VGLVKELGMDEVEEADRGIGLYLPAAAGSAFEPHMLVHTRGDPMAFVPRVRAIAGALDPTLELSSSSAWTGSRTTWCGPGRC
jgi:hypothetical protein